MDDLITPAQLHARLPGIAWPHWCSLLRELSRRGGVRFGMVDPSLAITIARRHGWASMLALPPARQAIAAPPAPPPPRPPRPPQPRTSKASGTTAPSKASKGRHGPQLKPTPVQQPTSYVPEAQLWELLPPDLTLQDRTGILLELATRGATRDGGRIDLHAGLSLAKAKGLLNTRPAASPAEWRPAPSSKYREGEYVSRSQFSSDLDRLTSDERAWFDEQLRYERAIRSDGKIHFEIACDLLIELEYGSR